MRMSSLIVGETTSPAGDALADRKIEVRSAKRFPRELVITERQFAGEPVNAAFRRLAAGLYAEEATLLSLMIYGSLAARAEASCCSRW